MRLRHSLLLTIVFVTCNSFSITKAEEVFIPDEAIQQKIREIGETASKEDGIYNQKGKIFAEALKLKDEFDNNPRLVMELLYFCEIDPEGDEQRGYACMLLLPSFSFSRNDKLEAVLPYIDSSDERVRRAVGLVLSNRIEYSFDPNYDQYRNLISVRLKNKEELPASLIRYMYHEQPGLALQAMESADPDATDAGNKEAIWAEHVIADNLWQQKKKYIGKHVVLPAAAEQIRKLAKHEQWWARFYAAEIMRQNIEFRQPYVIEQLAKDKNSFVRESITGILEKKQP